jgi:hypothetical protein
MYDTGKIIPGLIIFVGLITFPIWSQGGKAAPAPEPKLDTPYCWECHIQPKEPKEPKESM